MITVIETSTAERKQEIIDLFNEIKPYLDEGRTIRNALLKAGKINRVDSGGVTNSSRGWFKELIDYCETQGYHYRR